MKCFKFLMVCVLMMGILTGCQGQVPAVQEQPVPTASPVPATPKPTPLNGFVLPTVHERPVAVMIDNQGSRVLPQGGLNRAQVIYECLAEGGITRFMALFWGPTEDKIGPVRSSRHYFVQFAEEHEAMYVHIGWSPQAQDTIRRLGTNNINGLYASGVFYKMTQDRFNWQDKYTSYQRIMEYAEKMKYDKTTESKMLFKYNSVVTPIKGKNAKKVIIDYNAQADNRFEYDAKTKLYKRFRNGEKHMDRNSGKRISAGNIIVQFVQNVGIIDDKKNRQELRNIGSGEGWYITCGKAVKIKWKKRSETSKTEYEYANGRNIVLNPAQTWIEVMPPTAHFEILKK